jgi:hypothetical protein
MKYQYFSLGLELLLPRRQNRVGITSLFAIGLCVRTGRIANVLGIRVGKMETVWSYIPYCGKHFTSEGCLNYTGKTGQIDHPKTV